MAQQTASVSVTGTPEEPVFNFILPTGAKGEPGGWNMGTNLGVQASGTAKNLDEITSPGLYWQGSTATITSGLYNYPPSVDVNGSVRGVLEVTTWGGSSNAILQRFTTVGTGQGGSGAQRPRTVYHRVFTTGGWSAWSQQAAMQVENDPLGYKKLALWDDTANGWVPVTGPGGLTAPVKLSHTTDLNILFTPGIYAVTSAVAPNAPIAASGTLTVNARYLQGETYGPSITQHYVPFFGVPSREGQVEYRRVFTGDAWQPWRAYVAQRVDNSAGRTIYTWDDVANREQLIYGDTGNLNIVAFLNPNFQVTEGVDRVNIRRVGNVVTLTLRVKPAPGLVGLSRSENRLALDQIPQGFREGPTSYGNSYVGTASAPLAMLAFGATNTNGDLRVRGVGGETWKASEVISLVATWLTNEPWPTTLPGIPA